jgi:hypothetical protein
MQLENYFLWRLYNVIIILGAVFYFTILSFDKIATKYRLSNDTNCIYFCSFFNLLLQQFQQMLAHFMHGMLFIIM